VADLLAAYHHWHPQVRAILQTFEVTFRWAIFERSPMPRWSRGRVTLLGDACHAMLPFLAQGAAQAMEDGVTLARCCPTSIRAPPYRMRCVSTSRCAVRELRVCNTWPPTTRRG